MRWAQLRRVPVITGFIMLTLAALAPPVAASDFDRALALERSQSAIGRAVADVELIGVSGVSHQLSDFHGRPLVISLIFTSCHHICPTTTRYLDQMVEIGRAHV